MAEFLSLADVLAYRDPQTRIAVRAGQLCDAAAFRLRIAAWRAAFTAQEGRRWALFFDDAYEFAAALFGAWHAGVEPYLPADAQAATVARLRREVDGLAGDWPAPLLTLQAEQPAADADTDFPALGTSCRLVVYTSGSSGEPTAIAKRLDQLDSEVAALARCWPQLPEDCLVHGTVSHQHIYGLLFRVLWPLAAGRPFAAAQLRLPEQMAAELARQPSLLVTSPAHLKRLPAAVDWSGAKARLAGVFSSGGPLPESAIPLCAQLLGQSPVEIYGSSETGGVAWRQRGGVEAVDCWQPLPGVKLRATLAHLEVRSAHLPDNGWHAMPDRVRFHDEGFELLGRADRIVKIEEKRVSLDALEAALLQSGLLQDARALTLQGERSILAVVAVPNDAGWALHDNGGKRALNDALRDGLRGVVEPVALPRRWRYPWALPVNSQGKTTAAALVDCFDLREPEARLLHADANEAQLRLAINAKLPYFDGHFALAPVLPGVAQLEWVVGLGRRLFPLPSRFLRLETAKFQHVIAPGAMLDLELKFNPERGSLAYLLSSSAGVHASGRVVFGDAA
ncbi:AMP-binding protein [Chitinolyticbacter meiyuanensis]|uniref:AMP-binding protein n=1 Tax=Chitinolyticbacter meiyuanensis TaxID=682798 RepID=UPI0011E5C711|nr:AMP-binding protein [Chitinolyticbacter meiyuanensis]